MKKIIIILLFTIIVVTVVGCGKDESKKKNDVQGQWINVSNNNYHMYIDSKKIIYVNSNTGDRETYTYLVQTSNVKKNYIKLKKTRVGWLKNYLYTTTWTFTNNKKIKFVENDENTNALYKLIGASKYPETAWKYVNNKTKP